MTLAEFVAKYNGQVVRSAHGLGGQCVDLVELYIAEVFGDGGVLPGNAIDIFGERPNDYTWVRNDPNDFNQIPPRGAIMVWGQAAAAGTGPCGHVAIVLDSNPLIFDSFDQNCPLHSPAHPFRHTYAGVIGWGASTSSGIMGAPAPAPAPPAPVPAPVPVPVLPTPAQPPVPEPTPELQALYTFHPSPADDLHPPDGVMSLDAAKELADEYARAHVFSTIAVQDEAGAVVHVTGPAINT